MRKTSMNKTTGKASQPNTQLGIPHLEHLKAAVLRSRCSTPGPAPRHDLPMSRGQSATFEREPSKI
jgi:hypothetical protein